MINDTLADCLTRIRNAQRAGHASVIIPESKVVRSVLEVLVKEGFIGSYSKKSPVKEVDTKGLQSRAARRKSTIKSPLEVVLKYEKHGMPIIKNLKRISRSGKRVYSASTDLSKVSCGLGIWIVSTSEGVMSDRDARRRKLGGEVMAQVS